MNLTELDHALRKLRLSGMADTLETRLLEAQTENQAPIDTVSALVGDELVRRQDRLLARRIKVATAEEFLRSRVIDRLLRLVVVNVGASPDLPPICRRMSPEGGSTLITSAP